MLAFYDFDGTLAQTLLPSFRILNSVSSEFGIDRLNEKDIPKLRDMSARDVLKLAHVPFYKVPLVALRVQHELIKEIESVSLVPGVKQILPELKKRGIRCGVVTSNNRENVEKFLSYHKIASYFEFIDSGSSLFGKAGLFRKVLKREHLNREETLCIGDEVRDIEAAQVVGMSIVAVSWGFNSRKALMKYNPDYCIDDPYELIEIL